MRSADCGRSSLTLMVNSKNVGEASVSEESICVWPGFSDFDDPGTDQYHQDQQPKKDGKQIGWPKTFFRSPTTSKKLFHSAKLISKTVVGRWNWHVQNIVEKQNVLWVVVMERWLVLFQVYCAMANVRLLVVMFQVVCALRSRLEAKMRSGEWQRKRH